MESTISLMIIGNNKCMNEMLIEAFDDYSDINVVGVTKNNLKAVDLIRELKPHLVLMDVIEPGAKEIKILMEFNKTKKDDSPLFIILSEQGNYEKIKNAIVSGAKEYLIKPLETNVLVSRIRQVYFEYCYKEKWPKPLSDPNIVHMINNATNEILYDFGILSHLIGYRYIKVAMLYMVNNSYECKPFNKILYPLISELFQTTPQRVEKAIRNAITIAEKNIIYKDTIIMKDNDVRESDIKECSMLKEFPKRPSNSQFICTLANMIKASIIDK